MCTACTALTLYCFSAQCDIGVICSFVPVCTACTFCVAARVLRMPLTGGPRRHHGGDRTQSHFLYRRARPPVLPWYRRWPRRQRPRRAAGRHPARRAPSGRLRRWRGEVLRCPSASSTPRCDLCEAVLLTVLLYWAELFPSRRSSPPDGCEGPGRVLALPGQARCYSAA